MAKLNTNNFIKPLKEDLDENVVQHARISENAIIDIINPVTGTLDQIKITHKPYVSDDIVKVMYIIDTEGRDRSSPEPFEVLVTDLNDLYDWILIEE
tara:strand:+ start:1814 stop:2104 length:291 start_codon:yes stop_codon:yes gene_type:complete